MPVSKYAGRSGRAWRECVKWFKENSAWVCSRCGGDIPRDVDPMRDPLSFTLDHKIPLVTVIELGLDPYDRDNLIPMHRSCNSSKGSSTKQDEVVVSRQW